MATIAKIKEKNSGATITRLENLSEVRVACPGCKAFETLKFSHNDLVKTRKYTREGDHIYHDCGTGLACQLFY
jgi:hypothetical protein